MTLSITTHSILTTSKMKLGTTILSIQLNNPQYNDVQQKSHCITLKKVSLC